MHQRRPRLSVPGARRLEDGALGGGGGRPRRRLARGPRREPAQEPRKRRHAALVRALGNEDPVPSDEGRTVRARSHTSECGPSSLGWFGGQTQFASWLHRVCNDPSAGSPTETLLRLLLPLNDKV